MPWIAEGTPETAGIGMMGTSDKTGTGTSGNTPKGDAMGTSDKMGKASIEDAIGTSNEVGSTPTAGVASTATGMSARDGSATPKAPKPPCLLGTTGRPPNTGAEAAGAGAETTDNSGLTAEATPAPLGPKPFGPKLIPVPGVVPAPKGTADVGRLSMTSAVPVGRAETAPSDGSNPVPGPNSSASDGALLPGIRTGASGATTDDATGGNAPTAGLCAPTTGRAGNSVKSESRRAAAAA